MLSTESLADVVLTQLLVNGMWCLPQGAGSVLMSSAEPLADVVLSRRLVLLSAWR